MKRLFFLVASATLFGWVATPLAHAAKADGPKARIFAKYDKNKNGRIDGEEKVAVRKDFTADKEGAFKNYDKDKDGKLSDEEIAGIKPPGSKKKSATTEKEGKAKKAGKAEQEDAGEKKDKAE